MRGLACRATLLLAALLAAAPVGGTALAQPKGIFIPVFAYRTGPYAVSGIPIANGIVDYFTLVNERDGGINGVRLVWEECETEYDPKKGIECYDRMKAKGAVLVNPYSTPVTYQLVPRTAVDRIPVLMMGHGLVAVADGRWFPWMFNIPTSYWSQASAVIGYVAQKEGGLARLRGKKIAHVFLNNAYGKEANPTLDTLARQFGFQLTLLAVNPPGQDQKAAWRQVQRLGPNWMFLSGWGVMNQVAIQEAAAISYPMDRLIGNWWSASEGDVIPAGAAARGYIGATFHAPGAAFPVHQEILKHVYDKGKGAGKREAVGEALYNRGVANAMASVEAARTAMARYGNRPPTGEQMRWGLEHLHLTEKRLEELGMKGFMHPLRVTCEDHEGGGPVMFQQWDGKKWSIVSDWIPAMRDVVRPKIEAAAAEEGRAAGLTMRDCSKAGG